MKSLSIIVVTAFASTALTSANTAVFHAHDVSKLVRRTINPVTVNPTKVSVLSVLGTAGPLDLQPRPTGEIEPEWYKNLPVDIKSLLPGLYPVDTSGAIIFTQTAAPSAHTSVVSNASTITTTSATSPTSKIENPGRMPSHTAGLHNHTNSATLVSHTASLTGTSTSTKSFSGGAKAAISMQMLAVFIWIGVATGCFLFA